MDELDSLLDKIRLEENPINKAKHLKYLIHDKGHRLKEISGKLKIKESYLCHLLRLIKLPEIIVDGYYSRLISLSHLFVISRLKTEKEMVDLYEKILSNDLSVAAAEIEVRRLLYGIKSDGNYMSQEELAGLQKGANSDEKKMKVQVIQSRIKSRILVEIKGSLTDTTPIVREVLQKLKNF